MHFYIFGSSQKNSLKQFFSKKIGKLNKLEKNYTGYIFIISEKEAHNDIDIFKEIYHKILKKEKCIFFKIESLHESSDEIKDIISDMKLTYIPSLYYKSDQITKEIFNFNDEFFLDLSLKGLITEIRIKINEVH
ncbi:hypothetical protein LWE69_04050 [Paenibacillus sp. UKAQ_18]|nr:hypothetical protein [Paenibacillus sp. UKAQ_18]